MAGKAADTATISEAAREAVECAKSWLACLMLSVPGVWLEDKGLTLAIHYQSVTDEGVRQARKLVQGVLAPFDDSLQLIRGKKVWELAPRELGDKGVAVASELSAMGSRRDAGLYRRRPHGRAGFCRARLRHHGAGWPELPDPCPLSSVFGRAGAPISRKIKEGIRMNAAPQPFQFVTAAYLTRIENQRAMTIHELLACLDQASDAAIFYHTFQTLGQHHFLTEGFSNDFAQWVLALVESAGTGGKTCQHRYPRLCVHRRTSRRSSPHRGRVLRDASETSRTVRFRAVLFLPGRGGDSAAATGTPGRCRGSGRAWSALATLPFITISWRPGCGFSCEPTTSLTGSSIP